MTVILTQTAPRMGVRLWMLPTTTTATSTGRQAFLHQSLRRQIWIPAASITSSSSTTTTTTSLSLLQHSNKKFLKQQQQKQHQYQRYYDTTSIRSMMVKSTPPTSLKEIEEKHMSVRTTVSDKVVEEEDTTPGSKAFLECDRTALIDLFHEYAKDCDVSGKHLDKKSLGCILKAVGESSDDEIVDQMFAIADEDGNDRIELEEFMKASDAILGDAPARIVLIVGGPGSGKGVLSKRLERECGVVHLSSGDLLRDEVRRNTVLGRQVSDIMSRGELVSSAVIVTLIRRVMRNHPGKRVLLDGFPRSLQNAHDLVELCGRPELALHLECDDTILMERIISRGEQATAAAAAAAASAGSDGGGDKQRSDDNFHTALRRLRTYHKYHDSTMDWLREQHVPVVNLDCGGTADNVWGQLVAIGRLMRPATRISETDANIAKEMLGNTNTISTTKENTGT